MKTLFLIFNHNFTRQQEEDARNSLGIQHIVELPESLKSLWKQIPSDIPEIASYIQPIKDWLLSQAQSEDYVLIQGDFGACYLMVRTAFENGCIPIYATTKREAIEDYQPDGTVKMIHQFKHQRFRQYGK